MQRDKSITELEWLKITSKIIKAVNSIETSSTREEIIKLSVTLLLNNILETEEEFNDDIELLRNYKNKHILR